MGKRKHVKSSSTPAPLVDVVILEGGRFDLLQKCLAALEHEAEKIPLRVLIIDSSEAEKRIENQDIFTDLQAKQYSNQQNLVKRLQQFPGFPAGCNEGARMGSAPLILFLNDDCILHEGALDKMVRRMDDETIGVCGAKLLFPEDSTDPHRPAGKVQHVGHAISIRGDVIHPFVGWRADHPKTCISRDVPSVTGTCLMVRRKLFEKAGKFNEIYGLGCFEDADLCLQIRKMGLRVFVDTEVIGTHYVGATAQALQKAYPIQINSMTLKTRWVNSGLLQWTWQIW